MSDSMQTIMLRRAEWQKAKGHLNAMLEYFTDDDNGDDFDELCERVEEFVEWVENDSAVS